MDLVYMCVLCDLFVFSLAKVRDIGILPKYFGSRWSYCKFTVPSGMRCICAFGAEKYSVIGKSFMVFVNLSCGLFS